MRTSGLIVMGLFAIGLLVFILFLPSIFIPKRWLEITPGLERETVYKVLGVPDGGFTAKEFDGWHNPFFFGASVLIVRYDLALSKVTSSEIRTKWGWEYRKWAQDYQEILRPNKSLQPRPARGPG